LSNNKSFFPVMCDIVTPRSSVAICMVDSPAHCWYTDSHAREYSGHSDFVWPRTQAHFLLPAREEEPEYEARFCPLTDFYCLCYMGNMRLQDYD